MQTYYLTKYLTAKYNDKKIVIDAGALQMIELEWITNRPNFVLTPHAREFEDLFGMSSTNENVLKISKKLNTIILRKGVEDIACKSDNCVIIKGGNAGMTKGGTGDVLAGLIAALATKNDLFLATQIGSYVNKKSGEKLFEKVGYFFNASDLVGEIPKVLKEITT